MPVGLQVWEAVGDEPLGITLRYANEAASACPRDDPWLAELREACAAQFTGAMELERGERWWRAQLTPLGDRSLLATYWDVTVHKLAERSLRASERLNREIVSGLVEGVLVVDTSARVVLANEAVARLFGVRVAELVGRPLSGVPVDLLDDRGHLLANEEMPMSRALRGEEVRAAVARLVRRDGTLLWIEAQASPLLDEAGDLYGAVASYDDVTLRVEQDRRTRQEADTDPLTGLANRRALERTLISALARAAARGRTAAVLMLDLDGFKAINDSLGHAAGDAALREVGRRLRRCVRERDLVARLGGDEFVVLLTDVGGHSGAAAEACERVDAVLAEPIALEHAEVRLGAAIGVATFPGDGADAPALLAHADRAMYAAKAARNGRRVDSPA
ncbi:sensor domain-containing diguanylate cyclase [Candidatus Solirubrobacter pratensis]|uniref:sensor domain-containing diguanylate cyclase n=1 Tax=Candidatus Solirubrobacter pratensis TaxID=1298857 RepID=UPI00068403D1|nr:sensor domain-containing diguanylate cyclase [Candidatus Solirubrobacter pratensis]